MTFELNKKMAVEIEPGDHILTADNNEFVVVKVVQTLTNEYIVTDDDCWRPLSTYGETWWLIEEDDWLD